MVRTSAGFSPQWLHVRTGLGSKLEKTSFLNSLFMSQSPAVQGRTGKLQSEHSFPKNIPAPRFRMERFVNPKSQVTSQNQIRPLRNECFFGSVSGLRRELFSSNRRQQPRPYRVRGAGSSGARQNRPQAEPLPGAQRAGTHQASLEEDHEEAAYSVKAAKTKAPISTANAKAIRASRNLAIQANAELAWSFGYRACYAYAQSRGVKRCSLYRASPGDPRGS
jgi:hypothetical protein